MGIAFFSRTQNKDHRSSSDGRNGRVPTRSRTSSSITSIVCHLICYSMDIILYPNFIMKFLHTVYMLAGLLIGESNSHTSPCICTTVPCPVVGNNSLEEGGGGAGVYQVHNSLGIFGGKHSVCYDYVKRSGYGNRNYQLHPGVFSNAG